MAQPSATIGDARRPFPWRRSVSPERWLFGGTAVLLTLLILPPVLTLVRSSFFVGIGPGRSGVLSLGAYAGILADPDFPQLVLGTLEFACGSALFGLVVGAGLAWCTERTDTPLKGLVYAASFVSFAVPGVLRAIGWIFLLGPQSGAINQVFRRLTQARGPLIDIFTLPAMILVEGLAWVPVVFLMLAVTFRSMDAALEEAAMMSGAAMAQTLRRVTIRLAFPAIVAAGLLTFIRSTQAFEVPLLLGVPGKVSVLTTKVYLAMRSGILPDYSGPSAYGTLLVLFLVGFIYLYSRAVRSGSKYVTVTGKGFRPRVLELGAARYVAAAFVVLVVGLQFLPVAYLTFASFLRGFGLSGSLFSQLTLTNYVQTLANPNVAASLFNSFSIGATTATVVVMLAAVVAWILIRGRTAGRAVLDQLASLPLIFPGVVLGLAVLTLYISAPVRVYGTIWILVIAYVISFLPYGLRYAHVGLLQISPELEESGQVGGGTWGQVFLRIVVPLLLPALVAAWIFVFLLSIRELSAAALLYTATSPVVASTMLDLWQNANSNQVSAFGSIVSVLSIGLALVAYRLGRRWGIQT